jgi:hypothetical protein
LLLPTLWSRVERLGATYGPRRSSDPPLSALASLSERLAALFFVGYFMIIESLLGERSCMQHEMIGRLVLHHQSIQFSSSNKSAKKLQ